MTRPWFGALSAAVLLGASHLQAADTSAKEAALAAQQRFVGAYRSCNAQEMSGLVTDDMQFIHAGGNTEDRKTFLAGVAGCALTELKLDVSNTRMYGDTAVIAGKFHFKTKQGFGGTLVISEVFVKRDGKWLFASHQSTPEQAFGGATPSAR